MDERPEWCAPCGVEHGEPACNAGLGFGPDDELAEGECDE